jgi:hypothetical protein
LGTRTAVDLETVGVDAPSANRQKPARWWPWVVALVAVLIVGGTVYLAREWPFTPANVIKELELATSSTVQLGTFRRTFFPRPGCTAEQVVFRRGTAPNQETMTVRRLTIEGNLTGLFTKHLALIRAEDVDVVFPPIGTGQPWKPTESKVVVDELIASGALLEFNRHNPQQPRVRFPVHDFVVHHLASHDPMKFEVKLRNPIPPGEVSATGTFGPWKMDQVSATPVSGNYVFRNADLGTLGGIRGMLASDGKFQGTLESIEVEGKTRTPDFGLKDTPHKLDLGSTFDAEVDATNGDVTLRQVKARILRTTVSARGSIAERKTEDGKSTALDLAVRSGRIQDLLILFVSAKQAPLNGVVDLRAKTFIPPGKQPFLKRIQLTGDFGIEDAAFTKEETQGNLDKLSTAAQGKGDQTDNPDDVVSDLHGHVVVKNGVATLTGLSFRVPGAKARLNGTFDLITQKVDLHGMLSMDAKLPEATSGIKSFLLKAIDPLLKKNKRGGAKFPVSIDGTYQHPSYHADPI